MRRTLLFKIDIYFVAVQRAVAEKFLRGDFKRTQQYKQCSDINILVSVFSYTAVSFVRNCGFVAKCIYADSPFLSYFFQPF